VCEMNRPFLTVPIIIVFARTGWLLLLLLLLLMPALNQRWQS
jgi:hypothetical protein